MLSRHLEPDVREKLTFERVRQSAFTLVEMMVSIAILAILMIVLAQTFTSLSSTWTKTTGRASAFAASRAAFEALKLNLSQATLNTYIGYADANGNQVPLLNPSFVSANSTSERTSVPSQYLRASELHFVTGPASALFNYPAVPPYVGVNLTNIQTSGQAVFFQAPVGFANQAQDRTLQAMLNVVGYYVAFNSGSAFTAAGSTPRYRYRLMEVIQPAEENYIYQSTQAAANTGLSPPYNLDWIGYLSSGATTANTIPNTVEHPLAENIITMALLPKLPPAEMNATPPPALISTNYTYDSRLWSKAATAPDPRWRNQLPPLFDLVVVAIDEPSALRLSALYGGAGGTTPPFTNATLIAKAGYDIRTAFQTYSEPSGQPTTEEADIQKVETALANLGVAFRIFRTDVVMNNSQWSSN